MDQENEEATRKRSDDQQIRSKRKAMAHRRTSGSKLLMTGELSLSVLCLSLELLESSKFTLLCLWLEMKKIKHVSSLSLSPAPQCCIWWHHAVPCPSVTCSIEPLRALTNCTHSAQHSPKFWSVTVSVWVRALSQGVWVCLNTQMCLNPVKVTCSYVLLVSWLNWVWAGWGCLNHIPVWKSGFLLYSESHETKEGN